jgi:rubrerythrin
MATRLNTRQIEELLLQALETERGGIKLYSMAIKAAHNADLRKEWEEYLSETRRHEAILAAAMEQLGVDTEKASPGRQVVAHQGKALVQAIEMAMKSATPEAAELVAAECVVLAETKDHQNWELIGRIAGMSGTYAKVLKPAYEEVEKQEDHHLYHTAGWCRELWIESLGLPAVLPPPEEVKDVETAIGAARAEQAREKMV